MCAVYANSMCTNHVHVQNACAQIIVSPFISVMKQLCCVNSDLIHKIGLKVGDGLVCLHNSDLIHKIGLKVGDGLVCLHNSRALN